MRAEEIKPIRREVEVSSRSLTPGPCFITTAEAVGAHPLCDTGRKQIHCAGRGSLGWARVNAANKQDAVQAVAQ